MVRRKFTLFILAALLAGCDAGKKGPSSIGEAYVGPATLNLRQELAPKSTVVTVMKHGEKLEVLQTRRRFVRVRTPSGAIGWTDSRQLMSTAQMDDLRKLAEAAAKLPSQGSATVFEALNMHTEPNRTSPSFAQIPDNGSVQVLAHRLAPKIAPPPPAVPVSTPKPVSAGRKAKEKKAESKRIPPPPMPKPPPLPPNWLELSSRALPEPGAEEEFAREAAAEAAKHAAREKEEPAEKAPLLEDWSLVRTKDGRSGWVLSRMLAMSIPDEVAQYAEGHRITSYFPLADVKDGDLTKHYWLWTTITRGGQPYEFDRFRVFVWSLKRHRYETAYIERNVKGYYPVEAQQGTGEKGEGASFTVIVENEGQFFRKKYAFNGFRVGLVSKEPYQPASLTPGESGSAPLTLAPPPPPAHPGLMERLKDRAKSLFK